MGGMADLVWPEGKRKHHNNPDVLTSRCHLESILCFVLFFVLFSAAPINSSADADLERLAGPTNTAM
jgi:hypothetical protein